MTADSCTWVQFSRLPRGWVYYFILYVHPFITPPLTPLEILSENIYSREQHDPLLDLSYFNRSPPPDCLWQNMWSSRTVYGSHIWSPLAIMCSPPLLRCTTVCAIINSTLVPILLCEQSLLPASVRLYLYT